MKLSVEGVLKYMYATTPRPLQAEQHCFNMKYLATETLWLKLNR